MPKVFCITGMVIAGLIVLLFLVDVALGIPFQGANKMMDIVFILCGGGLGYLSWATWKEQV